VRSGDALIALGFVLACDRGVEVPAPDPSGDVIVVEEEPVELAAREPEPEPEAPPYGLPELTDRERTAMYSGRVDTIKPMRIHHVVGNETRHDLFFPFIHDRGGAYLGVAADANYTLIAVAKPRYAFLLDIDRAVVNTHLVYSVLIPLAETPDALLDYFAEDNRDATLAILDRELPGADRVRARTTFRIVREALHEHLTEIRTQEHEGQPTTWMSDPDAYGYVRRMFITDRIRIMPGNLGGDRTMATVSRAIAELGTTLDVVYESNAAEWFLFHKPYIDNMRALPISDDAVLCRTIDTKPYRTRFGATFTPGDAKWNYNVHLLTDYRAGLGSQYQNRNAMLQVAEREGTLKRETGTVGLSVIALAERG
jgi:hypothetical protein